MSRVARKYGTTGGVGPVVRWARSQTPHFFRSDRAALRSGAPVFAVGVGSLDGVPDREVVEALLDLPDDALLGCWCAPKRCHTEAVIEFARRLRDGV